jgi:hypothetical protein
MGSAYERDVCTKKAAKKKLTNCPKHPHMFIILQCESQELSEWNFETYAKVNAIVVFVLHNMNDDGVDQTFL